MTPDTWSVEYADGTTEEFYLLLGRLVLPLGVSGQRYYWPIDPEPLEPDFPLVEDLSDEGEA